MKQYSTSGKVIYSYIPLSERKEFFKRVNNAKLKRQKNKRGKQSNKRKNRAKTRKYEEVTASKAELMISDILKNNRIDFITEKTFTDLVNPTTNQQLRFDFYLPSMNTCIEYDGKQHFMYVPEIHGPDKEKASILISKQQKRDNIKDQYCKDRNINLIRLNHKDFFKLEESIKQRLAVIPQTVDEPRKACN